MWVNKMLVAYDGSAPSHKALDLAREIAAQNENSEVIFVHAVQILGLGSGAEGALMQGAESVLAELQEIAQSMPNTASARLIRQQVQTQRPKLLSVRKMKGAT